MQSSARDPTRYHVDLHVATDQKCQTSRHHHLATVTNAIDLLGAPRGVKSFNPAWSETWPDFWRTLTLCVHTDILITHRVAFKQAPGAQTDSLALKTLDVVCDDREAVFVVRLCTRMIE